MTEAGVSRSIQRAAVAAVNYQVEVGSPTVHRDQVLDLWARCGFTSGAGSDADRFDWFYRRNPAGEARIYLLRVGDNADLVGAAGAGSRRFFSSTSSTPLTASILVDFVVHPSHRSLFPALQLQRFARDQEYRHSELVCGFPGQMAVPIMARLGSTWRITSRQYAAVIRSASYLERFAPRPMARTIAPLVDQVHRLHRCGWLSSSATEAMWTDEIPPCVDALWQATLRNSASLLGEQTAAYIGWRFGQSSQAHWRYLVVTDTNTGQPFGCFVCQILEGELFVAAMIVPGSASQWLRGLRALIESAWKSNVRVVRFDFAGNEEMHKHLLSVGFSVRSERPGFISAAPGFAPETLPANWWFTRADKDV